MLRLYFAVGLLFLLGFFHRLELIFGQDEMLLSRFGLQRFEAFLKGFQIVTQPHAAHATGRDENTLLLQLIGDP